MALIKCPNCKKDISDTTNRCFHCKKRLDGKSDIITPKRIKICLVIILVIIIGIISVKEIVKFYNSKNEHTETKEVKSTDNENKNNDIEENQNTEDNTTNNIDDNKNDVEDTKKETSTNEKQNNNSKSNNSNNNLNTQQSSSKSIISATENKTCDNGYTLTSDKSSCEKTIYVNGNTEYICGAGFNLVGNKCKSSHTTTPTNGQCYGSYTLENDVCVMYIDANTSTSCPSGYDYANTSNYMQNKCSKIDKVSPSVSYSCPSGYTLNGTNCEK